MNNLSQLIHGSQYYFIAFLFISTLLYIWNTTRSKKQCNCSN